MYHLTIENKYESSLELTFNPNYSVIGVDGLAPPEATINTTHNAGMDGNVYVGSYVNERQIIITLAVNAPTEENRIALYEYVKTKDYIKVYYSNGTRDLSITGYVQNIDIGYFDKKETVQITIKCPFPYWTDTTEVPTYFQEITDLFELPVEIPVDNLITSPFWDTQSKTDGGITYTDNGDGSITVSGEGSGAFFAGVTIFDQNLENGTYLLTGLGENMSFYAESGTKTWEGHELILVKSYIPGGSSQQTQGLTVKINGEFNAAYDNVTITPMLLNTSPQGIPLSEISFEANKDIINSGDVKTGMVFTILAVGGVDTPTIKNLTTGEEMTIDVEMNPGDKLVIDTVTGEKSITLTLSTSEVYNRISALKQGSKWITLEPGLNRFYVTALSIPENMDIVCQSKNLYEGG